MPPRAGSPSSETPETDVDVVRYRPEFCSSSRTVTKDGWVEFVPVEVSRRLEIERDRYKAALEIIADSHDAPQNDETAREALSPENEKSPDAGATE